MGLVAEGSGKELSWCAWSSTMAAVMLTGQFWPAVKPQELSREESVTAGTHIVGGEGNKPS